jgi:hypothetical protein
MKFAVIFIIGVFLLIQGILYALQGSGIVPWPAESFMVNNHDWIFRGAVIALIGVGLIAVAWRLPKKP